MREEKKNVLYISYDGMTDPLGQSQVLPYLCGLSEKGYSITLLSCEKPERFNKIKNIIEDICKLANINWQPIQYTSKPPILSTIKDIRQLKKKAFSLHQQYHFELVHCRSYISAIIGLGMKKKFGTKFLFDMRGFWADERVDGGLWNLANPLYNTVYKYFKKKEKQYFEQADHIISLTNLGRDEIHSWKHLTGQPRPITVIPCCVDTALFDPAKISLQEIEQLRESIGILPSQLVIGYVGSIGTWYMLDDMLNCFKVLQQKRPNALMLFITTEPESMVRTSSEKLGIEEKAIIVKPAGRKEVPSYISLMQYSIFFIKPCFSKKASSPTKQGEIMAMGIPVICNAGVGDTDFVVDKYNSGVAVSAFTDSEYSKAIDKLLNTSFSSAEIRKGALEFYGLNMGIDTYEGVYKKLTTRE